jgi:hypothetical protein
MEGAISKATDACRAAYKEQYASFHVTKRRGKSTAKILKSVFKHALGNLIPFCLF